MVTQVWHGNVSTVYGGAEKGPMAIVEGLFLSVQAGVAEILRMSSRFWPLDNTSRKVSSCMAAGWQ